ncbi:hypothetical protein ACNAN0_06675 [Agrilactobacillus fermenti]|uniref:hypothetical protein n=1 Tax=Agrilactobacillus fermenti TaxID=2586909 RepID=UPI001E4ACCB3|nr:hypothetical protein [Agrilactobacillus fermenti]MCD2255831.1 hypothetical protein [Agrilactobacillus fermenti]
MSNEQNGLQGFPKEQFSAFSTAKMARFLPYTAETTMAQLRHFFGHDFDTVVRYRADQLFIDEKGQTTPVGLNKIIVQFPNGSYKIIDADYYRKNFNEPLEEKTN